MADDSSLTLEHVSSEVEKIGSMLRSMSVQIAGIRTRVADLEQWGVNGAHNGNGGGVIVAAKKAAKKRPKVGKKRPKPGKRKPKPGKKSKRGAY